MNTFVFGMGRRYWSTGQFQEASTRYKTHNDMLAYRERTGSGVLGGRRGRLESSGGVGGGGRLRGALAGGSRCQKTHPDDTLPFYGPEILARFDPRRTCRRRDTLPRLARYRRAGADRAGSPVPDPASGPPGGRAAGNPSGAPPRHEMPRPLPVHGEAEAEATETLLALREAGSVMGDRRD